uniref:F-box domain-containing protein n=1 Tax=Oryza meridionalis TaxID=40149 RepID=A0A0E0FAL4_9ORYZ
MAAAEDAAVPSPPPSLLSLCLEAVASHLTAGAAGGGQAGGRCGRDHFSGEGGGGDTMITPEEVAEALPWELLHRLASLLPPAALEALHHAAHDRCCFSAATAAVGFAGPDGDRRGIKRSRCEDFNPEWQALFGLRWPRCDNAGHDGLLTVDWQRQYWEKHLQECLDEAAESALLPSFCGSIDELTIPAKIVSCILHTKDIPQQYSRLSFHCSSFGCYARCLRLQSVLCTAEISDLLQGSKLEKLMFVRIISDLEVNGVCMLLSCHAETLLSLEFIHCQLSPAVMDKICNSVLQKGSVNHGIQNFSIKSSRICESNTLNISAGLLDFLSMGKSLQWLSLNDTKMQPLFAKIIVHTLLGSSSGIRTLEISENNIAGWLKTMDKRFACFSSALESNISLNSLTLLNLRGNNLNKGDIEDLCKILVKMPNLRDLDISDNPIMDEGIRLLICFISRTLRKEKSLSRLRAENCDLTNIGVTELLECLSSVSEPLNLLSIADNHLGSSVAVALAKFLGSGVRELNIEDIGFGPLGFQILEEALPADVALSHINVSKNRGGIRAARFVSRLIKQAPGLVSVNAGSNLLPPESMEVICDVLQQKNTCNLERLDLMGNMHLSDAAFPAALEFRKHGKQILIVPSQPGACAPYDDDP